MYSIIFFYLLQFSVVKMVTFGSSLGIFPHQTPPRCKLLHLPFCSLKTSNFICVFTLDLMKNCESIIALCQIFSVLCQFFSHLTVAGQDKWFGYFLWLFLEKLEFALLVADLDLHLCGVEGRDLALLDSDPPILPVTVSQAAAGTKYCLNERQIIPEDRWGGAHQQGKGHAGRHGWAKWFQKLVRLVVLWDPGAAGWLLAHPGLTGGRKTAAFMEARGSRPESKAGTWTLDWTVDMRYVKLRD